MDTPSKCADCGRERTLSYDTRQCHECEQAERERDEQAAQEAEDAAWPEGCNGHLAATARLPEEG